MRRPFILGNLIALRPISNPTIRPEFLKRFAWSINVSPILDGNSRGLARGPTVVEEFPPINGYVRKITDLFLACSLRHARAKCVTREGAIACRVEVLWQQETKQRVRSRPARVQLRELRVVKAFVC